MNTIASPIAGFEDWPEFMRAGRLNQGHDGASARLARALGVPARESAPPTVSRGKTRQVDSVQITELVWQLPFGPPTRAFLLVPEQAHAKLPGVLWLHCHGGNKWLGSERLIDLGEDTPEAVLALQRDLYEGNAVANEIARRGNAVLVHDSFSWGSRRFPLDPLPERTAEWMTAKRFQWEQEGTEPADDVVYNTAAAHHENTVAKVAGILGTSYAGMVAYEDLIALGILGSLDEIDSQRLGVGGFSGGGGRALVLEALAPEVRASVISCMMTTFAGLVPGYLDKHSWLLHTPGLSREFEWPELAFINQGCTTLIQFAEKDPLFPSAGMRAADAMLVQFGGTSQERIASVWHPGGHVFTEGMLSEAATFLQRSL